ncbi:MAG: cytidylate kinase-like family protein [Magnetococcales bacterium]|nr:cytidylate kinase-like family protein [Magnetococcales bacterium]MBF0156040.1 cytidylate kinase-like family protein [Magnetococcales bacterium]
MDTEMDTRMTESLESGQETESGMEDEPRVHRQGVLVVTVAGGRGAGREEVASRLARQLGLPCYDESLIERLVEASMAEADRRGREEEMPWMGALDTWTLGLLTSGNHKRQQHLLHLVKVVMETAVGSGVIIGAGAHLILSHFNLFRLKVEGGEDHCARRLAKRKGISFSEARAQVREQNAASVSQVREVFRSFPTENTYYDLVLNAETLDDEQMVQLAMLAMRQSGRLGSVQVDPMHNGWRSYRLKKTHFWQQASGSA